MKKRVATVLATAAIVASAALIGAQADTSFDVASLSLGESTSGASYSAESGPSYGSEQRTQAVQLVQRALQSLDAHGLDSDGYLGEFDAIISEANHSEKVAAFIEQLAADLRYGVTRAANLSEEQQIEIKKITTSLRECTRLAQCFQDIANRHSAYVPLQRALRDYRRLSETVQWQPIAGGRKLELGQRDDRVNAIRRALVLLGDYAPADDWVGPRQAIFDAQLHEAVKHFQRRHGLNDDGVIGPKTLEALNVSPKARVEQLVLSLERLRTMDDLPQGAFVQVNLPSFMLHGFVDEQEQIAMRVVIGKKARKTPMFDNQITRIVLNPTWTPTARILREDLLPKFRQNPDYAKKYQIRDRVTGEPIDVTSTDFNALSHTDIRVVQGAGRGNALGKVKFLLPDNDSIYLHDTSHPELFVKEERALSSGCIRLSDPKAFLRFVSGLQAGEQYTKAEDYYSSSSSRHLTLDNPVTVRTTYFTAWVDDDGRPTFYDDVYHRDDRLTLAMNKRAQQFAMK